MTLVQWDSKSCVCVSVIDIIWVQVIAVSDINMVGVYDKRSIDLWSYSAAKSSIQTTF